MNQLWKQAQVKDFGAGLRDYRTNPIGGGPVTPRPPRRRPSSSSKGSSSLKSSANSGKSVTTTTTDRVNNVSTPQKTSKVLPDWSTPIIGSGNSGNSSNHSVNSQLTTNATFSNTKSKMNGTSTKLTEKNTNNSKKRKSSALSDSASAKSSDSEDELATPTKTINTNSSPLPSSTGRRTSLPRRSKSLTPGKARYINADDDGTGKDDAAKEISSEEEWNGDDADGTGRGMLGGLGKGRGRSGTPTKKRKGWRERVGLKEGEEDD